MFVVFATTFVLYVQSEKKLERAHEARMQSYLLADEMRQSSDDLTRAVRSYVVTGEAIYKRHFQEILDIRDGRKPRPVGYQSIYWDLVSADDRRPRPMGPAVALLELMKQAGFTEEEFAKLAEAKASSDALTRVEFTAMALVDATIPPTQANQTEAVRMLFDRPYLDAKATIMRPIKEFQEIADKRTLAAINDAEAYATRTRIAFVVLGLLLVSLLWGARRNRHSVLGCAVDELHGRIADLGRGDFTAPIPVPKGMQNSVLGWLSETQINLARLDGQRRRAEADSAMREREMLRFEAAMDSVIDAIYVADRATMRYIHVNDAACRMQGKTRAELLAMGPAAVLGISTSEVERAYDALIASNNSVEPVEVQRPGADGSLVWIERRRHAVCLGGRWTVVSLVRDVTERKQALEALHRSESFNRAVLDASLDCLVTVDHEGRITEFNPAAVRVFGWTREQAVGAALSELLVPERFREAHERGFSRHLATGERTILGKRLEMWALRADGSEFPIELAIAAVEGTSRPMFAGFIRDITARKEAEFKLVRLNRVHAVMSGINALIVRVRTLDELYDESCRIACDAGGMRMAMISVAVTGKGTFEPVAWVGKDDALMAEVRHRLSTPELFAGTMMARAAREGIAVVALDLQNDPQLVRPRYAEAGIRSVAVFPLVVEGTVRGVLSLYSPEVGFFDEEEMKLLTELAGDIAFAIDHITKRDLLDYLSYYDSLTGLANRNLFLERVGQSLAAAPGAGFTPALFILDIERFKAINDTLGRTAGDQLLRQVAEVLTRTAGDAAKLSRLGLDHFALVQTDAKSEGDVATCLEKTIDALLEHRFVLENTQLRIAVKVGVAVFPSDGVDADALFRNAEAAHKKAKASGERYLFHTQTMTEAVARKLTLENRLRHALENGEFVLHYQPKVSLASGRLTGGEALIRWNDPLTGLVPPGRFIPLLEETGLIYDVGRWALRQALRDYLRRRAAGLPALRIAVNVSPLQLRRRSFVDEIADIVATDLNAAAGLELEITESLIMEDVQHSITSLERIRAMDVTIAIDDFGTGFSSLSYLARLPVDTLKIDRSFVVGMTEGKQGLALVSTIINLARSLKLTVVAEGVETEEQKRVLTLLGCDEMQGFLFSKPVPTEDFEQRFLVGPALEDR